MGFFLMIAAFIIFFSPTVGGWFLEHDNFIPANNLVTPTHIKPSWYFTPFYAILRMIPSFFGTAFWGVLGHVRRDRDAVPLALDRSPARCARSAIAARVSRWR